MQDNFTFEKDPGKPIGRYMLTQKFLVLNFKYSNIAEHGALSTGINIK